jgi:hypothetical protein
LRAGFEVMHSYVRQVQLRIRHLLRAATYT